MRFPEYEVRLDGGAWVPNGRGIVVWREYAA
jgi:hypothetical protein